MHKHERNIHSVKIIFAALASCYCCLISAVYTATAKVFLQIDKSFTTLTQKKETTQLFGDTDPGLFLKLL